MITPSFEDRGDVLRYQTSDGALVYSNVPAARLSGAERARLDRAP